MNQEIKPTEPRIFAFVGGGQMASALIGGLVKAGAAPADMLVLDPNIEQRKKLAETLGVQPLEVGDNRLFAADVVVWAVKPQALRQAVDSVKPWLANPLHISIAAGVRCVDLAAWLGSERVVRAMPNTAALVQAGVTGLAALSSLGTLDRLQAERLLSATGYCFWVNDDERLDAVTAVSGSGPAYVFHFLEAFQAAAKAVGFDELTARELVLRTASGALELARGGDAFSMLGERVTSPKGTTEAALEELRRAESAKAIATAVKAAYARAGEISNELAD